MCVRRLDPLEPGKSGDQHQERRARQVKIGQQQVDRAEAVAGHDEQSGLAGKGLHLAILGRGAFDKAQARRPDRDDTPAFALSRRDGSPPSPPKRAEREKPLGGRGG